MTTPLPLLLCLCLGFAAVPCIGLMVELFWYLGSLFFETVAPLSTDAWPPPPWLWRLC